MALVLKDRVKETTTTTGTGSFSLAGAVTGYDSFGQIGDGNTTYYAVYLDGGSEWEVGIGTYTAPSTLARTTILASSNSGSVVTFSAGQKTIWCDYPAGKAVYTDATGSISETIVNISGITGHISTPDYIGFDTTYATTLTAGQLGWNGNDTLGLGMIGGNVIQHIGEDIYFYTKASSAITKGQVVMFTGAVGASGVPTGAPATGITDGSYIMGIAAESIALNGFGLVQAFGTLRNVNTSGYADGDILWYDPTVTGGLTKTKPVAPNVKVQMAAVINGGSSGGGTILIRINAGSTLGGTDSNAEITSPTGGQTLIYDQTDGYWKNATLTDGTAISITEGASGTITIANTGVTALSAGTGISVSGSTGSVTVTNSAPDQTVSIASGTGISVTGTYPSFTVANTGVTSVTGTAPVVSSGGSTPAISMAKATGSVDGYLSSTDWTTFNNKQPAGTYVTSVSGTTGRITSSGGTTPAIDLASGVVTAGTTGSSTAIPVITVDTYGRVTNVTTASNPQGTVTSVAALTLGTTGTDLSSTVANGTTTPVITLQVPTASATNRGALSSADWTTFNNKAPAVTYTTNYVPYGQGTTTPNQSANFTYNGTTLTAQIMRASNGIVVNSQTVSASYTIATGDSAMSAGPVSIASGQTVTVSSGSRWVVL